MTARDHFRWQDGHLILQVYVQPRASRDEISGWHDKGLKVRLTSPPVEGAANTQLLKFMAKQFKVSTDPGIRILQGDTSRHKTLSIHQPACLPALLSSSEL